MTTVDRMVAAMQTMQNQMAALEMALNQEKARNDGMAKMADAVSKLAAKSGGERVRLVDTRGIGRPSNFGTGDEKVLEKTFPIWQRKLQNYVVSVYPDLQPAMEWAVMQGSPITDADINDAYGDAADALDEFSDAQDKDHQLYSVLTQVTEGEANDIVCNSRGSGFEAWRKLTRRSEEHTLNPVTSRSRMPSSA